MRNTSHFADQATALGLALVLVAACASGSAMAAVYKCVNERSAPPGSNPVYQDTPCPPGKELRNFDTDPAEVTVIPHQEFVEGASASAPKPAKPTPPPPKSARNKDGAADADIAQRKFIHPGMSEAEVVAKIGKPDITGGAKGRKSSRWSYLPAAGDPQTITTIVFDAGRVIEIERKVVH